MIHITESAFERMQAAEGKLAAQLDPRIRALPTEHLQYCADWVATYDAETLRVYFAFDDADGNAEFVIATYEQLISEINLRKDAPSKLRGVVLR